MESIEKTKGKSDYKPSPEEKEQLIRQYYDSNLSAEKFAELNGISRSAFYNWLNMYCQGGIEAFRSKHRKYQTTKEKEIKELKMIIADQQIEINHLKTQLKFLLFEREMGVMEDAD